MCFNTLRADLAKSTVSNFPFPHSDSELGQFRDRQLAVVALPLAQVSRIPMKAQCIFR